MQKKRQHNPNKKTPFSISKRSFYVGLLLGMAYAFSLYAFAFMTRETFRVLSFDKVYGLWTLTEEEHKFYNLSYAFIAAMIGQSICLKYWFDKALKSTHIKNLRKSTIVNNQTFLQWGFLSWFSKLAFIFAFFFGMVYDNLMAYQAIDIYNDYGYIFILFIVVLFFQSWIHIRKHFKAQSTKWILSSILIVSIFSFALSKIEFINYRVIDEIAAQNSIYQKYELQLAKAQFNESMPRKYNTTEIFIVLSKDKTTPLEPIIIFEGEKIDTDELYKEIYQHIRQGGIITLIIDHKTPMSFVNKLEGTLSQGMRTRFTYQLNKIDNEKNGYIRKIHSSSIDSYYLQQDNLLLEKDKLDISLDKNEQCYVNGNKIPKENLKDYIQHFVIENPNYYISLDKKDDNTFQQYIYLLESCKKAVHEIRNRSAQELFNEAYNRLDKEQKITVRKKHPLRIKETSNYLLKIFEFFDEVPPPK